MQAESLAPEFADRRLEGAGAWVGKTLAAAATVFAAAYAGIHVSVQGTTFFSPVWPASGVALGFLLLWGPRISFGLYAGFVAVGVFWDFAALGPWLGSLGSVLEALGAWWLLQRFLGPRPRISDLRSYLVFLLAAPWLPTALNCLFAFGLHITDGNLEPTSFIKEATTFLLANGMGMLLVAPAFASRGVPPDASWWKRATAIAVITALAASALFFPHGAPTPYLLLLPLIAAALMVGPAGTAPLVAGIYALAAAATFVGRGPFCAAGAADYPAMYTFLGVAAACAMAAATASGHYRQRMRLATLGNSAAGATLWSWASGRGVMLDQLHDDCPAMGANEHPIAPETIFSPSEDEGCLETRVGGRPALSYWRITRRAPGGKPLEAAGLILDMSARLSLEEARRQAWRSDVELRNLRASLSPHLLFNCLAAMRGIVRTEPERARAFIDQLARFLRDTTDAQSRRTIPLHDEWQLCEDFLALQALRYERELPRLAEIDGPAYHAQVPPMILLNLVENAVKHGEISQAHPLGVSARLDGERLELTVRSHGRMGPVPSDRPGGLGVARARLQALYADRATMDVRASGDDVVAEIRMPAHPPQEKGKS